MSNVEIQFGHSNIGDVVLKRIRKHWDKKTKYITEEKKQIYKAFFKGEEGVFNIEKLTRDVIKRCKLPKPIDLREETSIAEKIKKKFPNENIFLNKKVIKPKNRIFGLKIIILPLKLMQEIMEVMRQVMKKKENMFKKHNFKNFWYNSNDSNVDVFKFASKIIYTYQNYAKKSSEWGD